MKIHFISGLPRSGSTLLAAILRQNPRFSAAMSGPLFGMFEGLLRTMGESNEYSMFIDDATRERVMRGLFDSFYAEVAGDKVVFDTSRGWCAHVAALHQLFPSSRVICCVRSPAWILDSVERLVQASPFRRGRMFSEQTGANVYTRAEWMMGAGLVGTSLRAFRQAWSNERADRLIVIRYESLAEQPSAVIAKLYQLLGEEPFAHDFDNVAYDEPEFDARMGMPGLHQVAARVQRNARATILPADVFSQHDRCFWDVPGQNPRGVTVI